ncbi:MAG TPA: hypothetical protein VHM90_20630 [Phycisphaerae bacterium]|nr:hypothetical protein [Phycisphaerae bacterium]
MSPILRCCALFAVLLSLCGCAYRLGGRDVADPAWTAKKGSAGKVLLIVAGPPRDPLAAEHIPEVVAIASWALERLPDTTVFRDEPAATSATATAPAPGMWPSTVDDTRALAAAQARGADSVCVLTVGEYSGMFAIGLAPLPEWYGRNTLLYTLRLMDVRTGTMLAHAVTYCATGGAFQIRTREDMRRDLDRALSRDLSPPRE